MIDIRRQKSNVRKQFVSMSNHAHGVDQYENVRDHYQIEDDFLEEDECMCRVFSNEVCFLFLLPNKAKRRANC